MYNIFVGNLSPITTEHALRALFEQFGEVSSVRIVTDRDTAGPRGFGFVEMTNEEAGKTATGRINGLLVDERRLEVNEARLKENKEASISSKMRRHRKHRY